MEVSAKIRTDGGTFDPSELNVYFLASGMDEGKANILTRKLYPYILLATNQIRSEEDLSFIEKACDEGIKVFIDSGVYTLNSNHSKEKGISIKESLSIPPGEMPGFNELMDHYIWICKRLKDKCWGYTELDQGCRADKIQTRQRLHDLGFNPIPIYHPLNDGWEYFDELASGYDRLCMGNMSWGDRNQRKRLLATLHQRHSSYQDVWVHVLGLTPNEWLNAFPVNSCDSSAWIASSRWGEFRVFTFGKLMGLLEKPSNRSFGGEWRDQVISMSAYEYNLCTRSRFYHIRALKELGINVLSE